jgi:hypothetical protein
MLHDLVTAYADAMYVATMLRTPSPARPACGPANREPVSPGPSLARRIPDWLGRALGPRLSRGAPRAG